jgi:hypothetical protein
MKLKQQMETTITEQIWLLASGNQAHANTIPIALVTGCIVCDVQSIPT